MRIYRLDLKIALFIILTLGTAVSVVSASPAAQLDPSSGSIGDPGDLFLEYNISGVDFSQDTDGNTYFQGNYSGGKIHLSGVMICDRSNGMLSYVTMEAKLGDQVVSWPKEGEDSAVSGKVVKTPFDLSFKPPKDYPYSSVAGSVFVQACGGVCGSYEIRFDAMLPTPEPGKADDTTGMVEDETDKEGGFPWGLAIGAGVIGAAGVAAAATLVIAKALSQGKKPQKDEPMGYVLQVSQDTLMVTEQEPATLTVTAHRVDPGGATSVAPEVRLEITVGPNGRELSVAPKSGAGQLTCTVSLTGPPAGNQTTLTITGRARGSSTTATVKVQMEAYRIEFI